MVVCVCEQVNITSEEKTLFDIEKKTQNFKQQFNATIHAKIAANRKPKIGLVET